MVICRALELPIIPMKANEWKQTWKSTIATKEINSCVNGTRQASFHLLFTITYLCKFSACGRERRISTLYRNDKAPCFIYNCKIPYRIYQQSNVNWQMENNKNNNFILLL